MNKEDWLKYLKNHLIQYAFLIVTFAVSLTIIAQVKNIYLRAAIALFLAGFYFVWGVWHHLEEKNLTRAHIFEYLVVSLIILSVLAFIIAPK